MNASTAEPRPDSVAAPSVLTAPPRRLLVRSRTAGLRTGGRAFLAAISLLLASLATTACIPEINPCSAWLEVVRQDNETAEGVRVLIREGYAWLYPEVTNFETGGGTMHFDWCARKWIGVDRSGGISGSLSAGETLVLEGMTMGPDAEIHDLEFRVQEGLLDIQEDNWTLTREAQWDVDGETLRIDLADLEEEPD
jgi:hypothetical protein